MYVASQLDKSWLLNEQRKLYARSLENPDYVWHKLWGLVTDPRNLRVALARVASNRGRRTPGVDRMTVRMVLTHGVDEFVARLRQDMRDGMFEPRPVRRVLIPKAGQPGKFRPLGIPTVKDRVVQAAMKNILEPIYEADFYPVSYGFRPGKSVHWALEHLRVLLRPKGADRRLPYQWIVEGDIKGCFDNIDHHSLMARLRRRVMDAKVCRLVVAFLKAGILAEDNFVRSDSGTPQGGILSPLLANIALSAIEERYERHVWPRQTPTLITDPAKISVRASVARKHDKERGRPVVMPIRYADDFILLVSVRFGPHQEAEAEQIARHEKVAMGEWLRSTLRLELSEAKTLVTPVTAPVRFLGHTVRVRRHPRGGRLVSTAVIPKDRSQRMREVVKRIFWRATTHLSLANRLREMNPQLRGWCNFYRHAWGAKHVFSSLDHYVWKTILRWLRKKHQRAPIRKLLAQYAYRRPGRRSRFWFDGTTAAFRASSVRVGRYMRRKERAPDFMSTSMESPVHNERCTPGSERGARKPTGESQQGAERPL
jgi:RNA-directed DNA polymerase